MAHYLSQSRIEDPIWLEPDEISFLQTVAQRIEDQIEELRAQISELTRQKDAKLAEITSVRNVLAPVRRAPLEILSGIFELSCLLNNKVGYNIDLVRTLFALSGVCVAWRKAAHATPRLWCKLNISLHKHHLGSDFQWVTDWIARCQNYPLDLYLDLSVEQYELDLNKRGKAFLEYVLANFGHKIRMLDVYGQPSSILPILQLPPYSPLLLLERLSLRGTRSDVDTIEGNIELPSKVFLGSPKLQEVDLESVSLLKLLVLPAEQLTSMKLLVFSWELAVWDVLSRCSNLVSLEINGRSAPFGDHSVVSLPALKSFRVAHTLCFATGDFLRCLSAPLLETLIIGYDNGDYLSTLVDDLTTFQQRSATKLSSLTLLHWVWDSKNVIEKLITMLSLFPTIHRLEFSAFSDVNPLVRAMVYNEGHHILPNLKHLALLSRSYQNYVDASELKAMVLSRWWPDRLENGGGLISDRKGSCRLQKVTIRGFYVRSKENIKELSALPGFNLDYYQE